ncbi:MAG: lysine--tRNA ligase [Thermoplasmata archaeon]|nr:lysine--tRNA ligase [Thermoplasmata archaeon]
MPEVEESHLIRERRAKVEQLRSAGVEPYPWSFPGRVPTSEVVAACAGRAAGDESSPKEFRVAGRLRAVRSHGGTAFLDLDDRSGPLQLILRKDDLGEAEYDRWLTVLDPGDLVGAHGGAVVSRRGEPSLLAKELTLLAKAIAPPPEKFHGLKDTETRLRQRYIDLLASETTRQRFVARSLLTREVRQFLDGHGFLEVETATLVPVASGAAAQPFVVHSNYLDAELQLRIALELPLKRLLVGGLERVYEIGRCFRNEDLDVTHSPEFTMLELYWAYADYSDMRGLAEQLYAHLAQRAYALWPDLPGVKAAAEAFRPPFPVVDFVSELEKRSGISGLLEKDSKALAKLAREAGGTLPPTAGAGRFLDKLFEHYVEPTLARPTFVVDYPAVTTPLAKRHRSLPGRVERFEFFYRGLELGNAYSELNDPVEQEARFVEQARDAGASEDRYAYDADFVEALKYGMPPAAGFGFGIDRLMMALLGAESIKDVILFPQVRERA